MIDEVLDTLRQKFDEFFLPLDSNTSDSVFFLKMGKPLSVEHFKALVLGRDAFKSAGQTAVIFLRQKEN